MGGISGMDGAVGGPARSLVTHSDQIARLKMCDLAHTTKPRDMILLPCLFLT